MLINGSCICSRKKNCKLQHVMRVASVLDVQEGDKRILHLLTLCEYCCIHPALKKSRHASLALFRMDTAHVSHMCDPILIYD